MRIAAPVLAVAVAVLGGGALIDGCYEQQADVVPPDEIVEDAVNPFLENGCGTCHTLAAAGADAPGPGPNLDRAGTPIEVAVQIIRDGRGGMPAFGQTLTDEQIQWLAEYVATAALTPPDAAPPATTQAQAPAAAPPSRALAAAPAEVPHAVVQASTVAVNCGACHTLAAAGASGRIGPNLDEHVPSVAVVEERIRHGGDVMPPFGDLLSDGEIRALAAYVVQASASTVTAARR